MRRLFILVGLCGALLTALVLPASGVAAKIVAHFHESFTEVVPNDEICGISGTSVLRGMDNVQVFANGTFKDESTFRAIFTAAESGKSVELFVANQVSGTEEPIDNGDGTITFVATVKGLPEKLKIPHGPTLTRDAGIVTQATTFLVNPDGSLTFVSSSFSNEKGPHPDLESDFELFCQVVVPALT